MEELFSGRNFYPLFRNGRVVYVSRVFAQRYIIILGEGPHEICTFDQINWTCIQTRTLDPDWVSREYPNLRLTQQNLDFKNFTDDYFENGTVRKDQEGIVVGMEYKNYHLNVLLLNDPKIGSYVG